MNETTLPKPFQPDALAAAQLREVYNAACNRREQARRDASTALRALVEALTPFREGELVEYIGPMTEHRGRYAVVCIGSPTLVRGLVSAAPITKAGHPHPKRRTRFEHGRSSQNPAYLDHVPDADHLVKVEAKP